MNIKQRLDANLGAIILDVGDSLTGNENWHHSWRKAELLAALYPTANVVFGDLDPYSFGSVNNITVRSGTGQQIKVVRDGKPGATTISRRAEVSQIYYYPFHHTNIFLGINNVVNNGNPGYTVSGFMDDLAFLGCYARNNYGAGVTIIPPCWSQTGPSAITSGYAANAIATARKNSFGYIESHAMFQDHYSGSGQAGQGNWFPFPNGDVTHFGGEPHMNIANMTMPTMGF
ncbi:hypothetical protein D9M73_84940 [compost metagenome]|nr:MAG TPA: hypothetical protein [Caudoviricetes sp.]